MLDSTKQLLEITRKNFRGELTHLTIEIGRLEWLIEQAEKVEYYEEKLTEIVTKQGWNKLSE